jgi:N6-L-threonylcarbamoyladenine synthase
MATAKGLATGLNAKLYGVSTSDALAWDAWGRGIRGSLRIVTDALRGEVYPARFELESGGVRRLDPHSVIKAEILATTGQNDSNKQVYLAGDALYKYAELFRGFELLPQDLWLPTGTGLLRAFAALPVARDGDNTGPVSNTDDSRGIPRFFGRERKNASKDDYRGNHRGGQTGDPATLLPVYTRLSDAEENERKRLFAHGALAQGALVEVPSSGVGDPQSLNIPVFRPAAIQDVGTMVELENSLFGNENTALNGECWTPEMFAEDLEKATNSWWVCYRGSELWGYAGGRLSDGELHIMDLAVLPQARRRKIASGLIKRLADDGRALGAESITLEVREHNSAAIALYRSLGLTEQGRRKRYYASAVSGGAREDALIMTGSIDIPALNPVDPSGAAASVDPDDTNPSGAAASVDADPAGAADLANPGSPADPSNADHPREQPPYKAHDHPVILAIESSCDETAVAVIDGQGQLMANQIASQIDFHARFGGVVPEIASRKHTESIVGVVQAAMTGLDWSQLDAIAVTYAPGLIGALVVGMAFAKGLSWALDVPLIKVNHLEGHIYAVRFANTGGSTAAPPFVIALLSGGNTMLVYVKDWGEYRILGTTLDDAVGEAYDKVAKAMGLGYPGGPKIAALARQGDRAAVAFPRALLHSGDLQFSLSGLKTAVLTYLKQQQLQGISPNLADIAASFEQAVIDVQVAKALRACEQWNVSTFCLGGGVAANEALRTAYRAALEPRGIRVVFPPPFACTDNAAMIAAVALERYRRGRFATLDSDALAQGSLEEPY